MNMINLSEFAGGAVDERFNIELQEVLENMQNLNTDPLKARTITLKITLKGNSDRNLASAVVDAKSSLVPANGISSTLILDQDKKGNPVAAELKSGIPGQSFISDKGEVLDDKGNTIMTNEEIKQASKVVNFK